MPLSEESDPFARRHFAGSSGGETVPPWNGASGTRARCPVRVDQVQPEPVPDGPGHAQPGRTRPASISSRNEKSQSERPAPPALAFLLPTARPDQHPAAPISTEKARAAHGDDLPDLPGLGGVGPPDEQRTARPITCPAWVVSACPMNSGPPTRSPARAAPSSRTPPPP